MKTKIPYLILAGMLGTSIALPASTLYWDGNDTTADANGGAGTWDTTANNWDDAATAGSPVIWNNATPDSAIFGGTNGTVTLGTAITADSLQFDTANYVVSGNTLTLAGSATITANVTRATITSIIDGSSGLTKEGTASLHLTGANTYTGATNINSGTLWLGNGGTGGSLNTASAINIASGASFRISQSDDVTQGVEFSGAALTGDGQLVHNNAGGTLILPVANSHTGGTFLFRSRVRAEHDDALGTGLVTLHNTGARLELVDGITLDNDMRFQNGNAKSIDLLSGNATISSLSTITTVEPTAIHARFTPSAGATLTVDANITGSGGVTKHGAGTVILTNAANNFTGYSYVYDGTLRILNGTGTMAGSSMGVNSGGTLQLVGNNLNWTKTINGDGTDGTIELEFGTGSGNTYLNNITSFTGAVDLTLSGASTSDKWNVNGVNAGSVDVTVNDGTQLFVNSGTSTFNSITVSGTGNTENRGAIRMWNGGTLNGNIILAGDTTIGLDQRSTPGTISGTITSGAAGTQTLTLGVNDQDGHTGSTLSGAIGGGTGTINVVKAGNAGTAILSGANTYTGTTAVNAGELILSGNGAINHRSATTVESGATLSFTGTGDVNNQRAGRSILLKDGSTLQNTNPNDFVVLGAGGGGTTVDTGASVTINLESNAGARTGFYLDDGLKSTGADTTATVTINATNAGNGVNLRNNNTTFAGTLIVNGIASATEGAGSGIGVAGNTTGLQNADIQLNGTMELMRASSNQAISWANGGNNNAQTFQMGALSGSGVMVGNHRTAGGTASVTLGNTGNNGTFSGVIADGLNNVTSITKTGIGTQTLSGNNTYTGNTTVNDGTLQLQGGAFSTQARDYSIASGAVLNIDGDTNIATGTTDISGTGTLLVTGGTLGASGPSGPDRHLNLSLGSDALIDIEAGGEIRNGGWQAIDWTSNLADLTVDGTLDVWDGTIVKVDALNGSGTITKEQRFSNVILEVGVDNGSGTFSGTIGEGLGAAGTVIGLTKSGTGTQTLSGSLSYTGTTDVNAGTLLVNGTHTGGGAYTVGANGTLAGSGTITATVDLSGAISAGDLLSPGNSPGTLATGTQIWNNGGSYLWEINASDDAGGTIGTDPGWDWLDITGELDLTNLTAGGFTIDIDSLTLSNIAGDADGFESFIKGDGIFDYSFTIATASAGISGFEAADFFLDSSGFSNGPSWNWQIALSGTNDLVLQAYAVPEPSSTALLGLGGLALMLRRKRS